MASHFPEGRQMKPTKSILDKSFKYVNAAKTNVAATFARVRREMRDAEAAKLLPGTRSIIALRPRDKKRG